MNNLYNEYKKVQIPLIYMLLDMENRGITADLEHAEYLTHRYKNLLNEKSSEIYDLAGKKFNIKSSVELARTLFYHLDYESINSTEKTGMPKTDKQEMETLFDKYGDDIFKKLIDWSQLNKVISSFLDPILTRSIDGIVHCNFNQTGTKNSRLSSSKPNMQQIPTRSEYAKEVRKIFSAREGYSFMSMDLSAIEMRIFAWLTKDPILTHAIYNGIDIHSANAMMFFNMTLEEVTEDRKKLGKKSKRDVAKHVGFACAYGAGDETIQKTIKNLSGIVVPLKMKEAKKLKWDYSIESIKTSFNTKAKEIIKWKSDAIKELKKTGEIITAYGRRRRLPNINSLEFSVRSAAEREGINALVQSPAGEYCLRAGIDMHPKLKAIDSHALLNIHDEWLSEVRDDRIEESYQIMRKAFLTPIMPIDIPVGIECEVGKNWGEMEFYKKADAATEEI